MVCCLWYVSESEERGNNKKREKGVILIPRELSRVRVDRRLLSHFPESYSLFSSSLWVVASQKLRSRNLYQTRLRMAASHWITQASTLPIGPLTRTICLLSGNINSFTPSQTNISVQIFVIFLFTFDSWAGKCGSSKHHWPNRTLTLQHAEFPKW